LLFFELTSETGLEELHKILEVVISGNNLGVISEAGCPGIADPGSSLVNLAHSKGIEIVPFVGPSSILLALISSGLNGQNFAFNGYLPVKNPARISKLIELEKKVFQRKPDSNVYGNAL
jgi:16S rRNA (cytidine1402-2'-O)-methyltransferase